MYNYIGTIGKDIMSGHLWIYSKEEQLSGLDPKHRVSVWYTCMCLISV